MLIANDNKNTINAKDAVKEYDYQCPICHEIVILKQGNKIIPHFAHQANSDCVGNTGETRLHLRGKQKLFRDLIEKWPQIKLEVYLPNLNQRPDLLFNKVAIEYQCSPISNKRLKERVRGYQSQQIKSIWILGMDYFKRNLHAYSVLRFIRYRQKIGYYLLFLDAEKQIYYLKYQMIQVNNRILCQQKRFNSYQELIYFINELHFRKVISVNLMDVTKLIESKIRHQDYQMLKLQALCYENGHIVTGCPLIIHQHINHSPLLNRNWLEWKIKVILYLENKRICTSTELFHLIEIDEFLFVAAINPIVEFVQQLEKLGYLKIYNKKIKLIKKFHWYRDTYDKIDAIKRMKKRKL